MRVGGSGGPAGVSPRPQARAKLDQLPDHDSDSNAAGDSLDHLGICSLDVASTLDMM